MVGAGSIGAKIAAPVTPVSWPASCRPSTTLLTSAPPVVDGRAKPHTYQDKMPDGEEPLLYRHGPDKPGHDGERMTPAAGSFPRPVLSRYAWPRARRAAPATVSLGAARKLPRHRFNRAS